MGKKHIIWQNYDLDLEDWRDEILDTMDANGELKEDEEPSEDKLYEWMYALNDEYFEDERSNLNKELPTEILIIGDLGFWDGRVTYAYKEIHSNNLINCLQFERGCDYAEWYVDEFKNLRSRQSHHDGTHYLLYRRWKDGLSEEQKENFLNKMYCQKATKKDITRYTKRIGDIVSEIYGWN